MTDRLPTKPFQDWIEERVARYEREWLFGGEIYAGCDAVQRTAYDLGLSTKAVGRYRSGSIDTTRDSKPVKTLTKTFRLEEVEEALWHAGVFLWEVYSEEAFPELYVIDETAEPYPKPCVRCGEKVPTHNASGRRLSAAKYREKRFCGRECYVGHKVAQITPRACEECGAAIPTRRANGTPLGPKHYEAQRFCDRECFEKWCRSAEGREAYSQRGRTKAA